MKVILKDFQILEGEHIFDFNQGINVIVGPNASGKSSLFYAIENCLTNPNGVSDCINFNHNKTEVTIEDNNESITWIRTPDSSAYKNNKTGEQYVKASKLDSRNLANLGFYFDEKGKIVNIHNEWSVLFPFGESDSEMFRLFEDIFNLSCSFQIIDEIKKDEQQIKADITQQQKDKVSCEDKLQIINDIKSKVNEVDISSHINSLELSSKRASEVKEDYQCYSKNSLLEAVNLPEPFDVSKLYETSYNYETIRADYINYQANKSKAVLSIPKISLDLDISDTKVINNDYEQYCISKASIIDYNNQVEELNKKEIELQNKIAQIKVCPTCGKPLEE